MGLQHRREPPKSAQRGWSRQWSEGRWERRGANVMQTSVGSDAQVGSMKCGLVCVPSAGNASVRVGRVRASSLELRACEPWKSASPGQPKLPLAAAASAAAAALWKVGFLKPGFRRGSEGSWARNHRLSCLAFDVSQTGLAMAALSCCWLLVGPIVTWARSACMRILDRRYSQARVSNPRDFSQCPSPSASIPFA